MESSEIDSNVYGSSVYIEGGVSLPSAKVESLLARDFLASGLGTVSQTFGDKIILHKNKLQVDHESKAFKRWKQADVFLHDLSRGKGNSAMMQK
jgi:hypothetical protein